MALVVVWAIFSAYLMQKRVLSVLKISQVKKVREEWLIPKMRNEMWPMRVMLLVIWDKDGK